MATATASIVKDQKKGPAAVIVSDQPQTRAECGIAFSVTRNENESESDWEARIKAELESRDRSGDAKARRALARCWCKLMQGDVELEEFKSRRWRGWIPDNMPTSDLLNPKCWPLIVGLAPLDIVTLISRDASRLVEVIVIDTGTHTETQVAILREAKLPPRLAHRPDRIPEGHTLDLNLQTQRWYVKRNADGAMIVDNCIRREDAIAELNRHASFQRT